MPFGWRRWIRWGRGMAHGLWYLFFERFVIGFVLIWSPLFLLAFYPFFYMSQKESGESDLLQFAQILAVLTAISSFLLQYRNHIQRQRAENLQSSWDRQSVTLLALNHQSLSELWPVAEWLRLPLSLRRQYPLAGLEAESSWRVLLESLVQRFHSIPEGDIFFQQTGFDTVWGFLALRFPHSREWDLALLLSQWLARGRLHMPEEILRQSWEQIFSYANGANKRASMRNDKRSPLEGHWSLLVWLLGSILTYVHEHSPPRESLFDDWLGWLPAPAAGWTRDLARDERLPLTARQAQGVLRISGQEIVSWTPLYHRLAPVAIPVPQEYLWHHLLRSSKYHFQRQTGAWLWHSPVGQDRRALLAFLVDAEFRSNAMARIPVLWQGGYAAMVENEILAELVFSLAQTWLAILGAHPKYFLMLSPCRQRMLLNLFFAVWASVPQVQHALRHAREAAYKHILDRNGAALGSEVLFERLLARVDGHTFQPRSITHAQVAEWLRLRLPGTHGIALMVSSDLAPLPRGVAQAAVGRWLQSLAIPILAILESPLVPSKEAAIPDAYVYPLRWEGDVLEEAWNRLWRECYGLPSEQEIPWVLFFPKSWRSRLLEWQRAALKDARGSWYRFVGALQSQLRSLSLEEKKEAQLNDPQKYQCLGL